MNREERVAFNAKKRKIVRIKLIVIAILCVVSGTLRYYYDGYKGNDWILSISIAFAGLGWVILFLLFGWEQINSKNIIYKKNKQAWFKQKLGRAKIFIVGTVLVGGYLILIDKAASYRVNNILSNEPTKTTMALVIDIQMRQSRGSSYYVAIIEYVADDIKFQKAVNENLGLYKPGEKYTLKYSVEYPEMFRIYR